MIVLASTISRVVDHAGRRRRARPAPPASRAPPRSGALRALRASSPTRGIQVRVLVAEPGRVVELGERDQRPRPVPDLLFELAVRGRLRRLAVDVALARGDLERARRRPRRGTGARAARARRRPPPARRRPRPDGGRRNAGAPRRPVPRPARRRARGIRRGDGRRGRRRGTPATSLIGSDAIGSAGSNASIGSRGARPSARSRAARTNAANSGCGRSGRLLNSGCACVATKNGCTSRRELHELDEPVVGRRARADEPGLLEPAAVAVVHLVAVTVPLVHDLFAVGLLDRPCRRASFAG